MLGNQRLLSKKTSTLENSGGLAFLEFTTCDKLILKFADSIGILAEVDWI